MSDLMVNTFILVVLISVFEASKSEMFSLNSNSVTNRDRGRSIIQQPPRSCPPDMKRDPSGLCRDVIGDMTGCTNKPNVNGGTNNNPNGEGNTNNNNQQTTYGPDNNNNGKPGGSNNNNQMGSSNTNINSMTPYSTGTNSNKPLAPYDPESNNNESMRPHGAATNKNRRMTPYKTGTNNNNTTIPYSTTSNNNDSMTRYGLENNYNKPMTLNSQTATISKGQGSNSKLLNGKHSNTKYTSFIAHDMTINTKNKPIIPDGKRINNQMLPHDKRSSFENNQLITSFKGANIQITSIPYLDSFTYIKLESYKQHKINSGKLIVRDENITTIKDLKRIVRQTTETYVNFIENLSSIHPNQDISKKQFEIKNTLQGHMMDKTMT